MLYTNIPINGLFVINANVAKTSQHCLVHIMEYNWVLLKYNYLNFN